MKCFYHKSGPAVGSRGKALFVYFVCYTAVFLCLASLVFAPFFDNGRSFIWDKDGLYQTFTTMEYYSGYWREFFYNLFVNHRFALPMVDYSVGLGFDVMTTLNHYGFGDPLLLLAIPFQPEDMELCYGLIAVLRYYLAGLTFSCYSIYMGRKLYPSLIGAFFYAFCGFALYAGVRHPYFLNSMIYLPLMLIGAERIVRRKSGLLLSVTIGIAASSNFYFMYMLTILTFLYALVRFFNINQGQWRERVIPVLLRGIGYYMLGIGLAGIFLFPSILAFFGNARTGIQTHFSNSMLFYEGWFYKELLYGFLFPDFSAYYWVVLSYGGLAVFSLFALFAARGRYGKCLKIIFAVLTFLLIIPFGGLFMNGFSYVSHRWIYGYSFFIAAIIVYVLEKLPALPWKKVVCSLPLLALMGAAGYLCRDVGYMGAYAAGMVLAVFCGIIFVLTAAAKQRYLPLLYTALFLVSCGTILINAKVLYSPGYHDYVSQFHPQKQTLSILTDCPEREILDIQDESFYRVNGGTMEAANNSMIMDINGVNGFFSLVSDNVYQYMKQLEMDNVKFPNWFYGFGGRAPLETLASVKYFTLTDGSEKSVPFGYTKVNETVYENDLALPIGYVYHNVLGESEFQKLNAVRKQQAMMQSAVVSGNEISTGELPVFTETELPYSISRMENMSWNRENGQLMVGEGGGDIYLSFEGLPDCETYLRFDNYDINDSGYELLTVNTECGDGYWKKFYEASTKSVWYGGFHDFIVNLGYTEEGKTGVRVNFPFEGSFRLDGFQIYCMPASVYENQAMALKTDGLANAVVSDNRIRGEVNLEKDGMLCISVPYSKGWKAKIDGKPVKVEKANLMYMAVPVREGTHQIEFSYMTPGLRFGCFSFFVCVIIIFWLLKNGYTNKKRI